MRLAPLQIKLLRDLKRLWAQALAIALVMAAGVATLVLGVGAIASLEGTRDAYYEGNRFAEVFATVTRAPRTLLREIAALDGVLDVEGRIVQLGLLDLPGMTEPGSVLLVSAPEGGPGALNQLYLRVGRPPAPGADEAVISERLAEAHRLEPGSSIRVLMNGLMRELEVVGVALSPEFIYAIGPGEILPDEHRFGIAWVSNDSLTATFGLEGAFNDVALKLVPKASEDHVVSELDALLAPYGGTGAVGRKDQTSHAFLDAELQQLRGMSQVLPPIFLLVSAFLVNMTLSRLVTLEREQIGLLKALGYGSWAIVRHYVSFVLAIAVFGIGVGWAAGAWLGAGLARLYADLFDFPYLIFSRDPGVYAVAALVTVGAAVMGAVNAVRTVAWLPPAVAMSPPAPARYRRLWSGAIEAALHVRQTSVMVARHLLRWPLRTAVSTFGIALAVAILTGSLWSFGAIERMIDLTFFESDRQDVTLTFVETRPMAALHAVRHMPGVLRAEPFRSAPVRVVAGSVERRVALVGLPRHAALSQVLGPDEQPLALPEDGVVLSEALADLLRVQPGQMVDIEVLDGDRRVVRAPVSGIGLGYLGLTAFAEIGALNRMLGEGQIISGVRISLDAAAEADFYADVKDTPQSGYAMLKGPALIKFRETLAEHITMLISVFTGLAVIIAFGVVYNFARISLSEQGRELASLRVLGFTRGEVAAILYTELAAVLILAQPLGWLLGVGISLALAQAYSSELYRVPLVIGREVYAISSLIVLGAAGISAAFMRHRIARLDMIEVLKTRE